VFGFSPSPSLHTTLRIAVHASGLGTIPELQRLTVSFAGGSREDGPTCSACFSFKPGPPPKLDAYSDNNSRYYVVLHKGKATMPVLSGSDPYRLHRSSGLGCSSARQALKRRQASRFWSSAMPASSRPSSGEASRSFFISARPRHGPCCPHRAAPDLPTGEWVCVRSRPRRRWQRTLSAEQLPWRGMAGLELAPAAGATAGSPSQRLLHRSVCRRGPRRSPRPGP